MLSLDMPDMPPSHAVMVVASADVQKTRGAERILGICMPIEYVAPGSTVINSHGMIGDPGSDAAHYLSVYEKLEITKLPPFGSYEIVKAPVHTKLVLAKNGGGEDAMYFVANPGYVGRDYVELRVNIEGRTVKLAYYLNVTKVSLDSLGAFSRFCPGEPYWKISMSEQTTGATSFKINYQVDNYSLVSTPYEPQGQ